MPTRILITGELQGIGFDTWLMTQGNKYDLKGTVRYRSDGSVEALITGEAHLVERVATLCKRGPVGAKVAKVEVTRTHLPITHAIGRGLVVLPRL